MTHPAELPALTVELTTACNQRCAHCYNAFDHAQTQALPAEDLLSVLGRALDEVEWLRVDFSGGEPFTHDGLFAAMALCNSRGVRANVVSNATMVTDQIARRMAPFSSSVVQVTLNGPSAETHDAAVGMPGAWQRTLRGIALLREHGVTVIGCMVVTRRNYLLVEETLDRMRDLGITTVALMRLLSAGVSAKSLELLPARSDLLEVLRQASSSKFRDMFIRIGGPIPPCVVDQREYPTIRFTWCPIGTPAQDFVLGSDGSLRLCPFSETVLGDVRRHSFAELMQAPAVTGYRRRAPDFCRGCAALPRCIGGCGAAAVAVTGDANSLDPLVLQHVSPDFARRVQGARVHRG